MDNKTSSSGMSFFGVLGTIFVVLKFLNVIDWPWLWVLSPFWIGLIVSIIVVAIVLLVVFYNDRKDSKKYQRKNKKKS